MEAESEDLGPQRHTPNTGPMEAVNQIQIGEELTAAQKYEVQALIKGFRDVFQDEPGWVQGTYHSIRTPPGSIV